MLLRNVYTDVFPFPTRCTHEGPFFLSLYPFIRPTLTSGHPSRSFPFPVPFPHATLPERKGGPPTLRPLDAQRLPNPLDGVLALASILQHALEHAPHGRADLPPLARGLGPAVPRAVDLGPLALPDLLRVAGAQVREAGLEGGFLLLEGGDGGAEVGGGEGGCEGLEGGAQGFEGGEEGGGFGC